MLPPVSKSRYELDLHDTNRNDRMTMTDTTQIQLSRLFFPCSIYYYLINIITNCYQVVLYRESAKRIISMPTSVYSSYYHIAFIMEKMEY